MSKTYQHNHKFEPGELIGEYRVERQLGSGGNGTVYLCRSAHYESTPKAVKVLGLSSEQSLHEVRDRWGEECKVLDRLTELNHPHIVPIKHTGLQGGLPYIVMSYIDGSNLAEILESNAVNPRRLYRHMADVTSALAAAHAANIMHRDLKPENVLVDRKDRAHVIDFGIAKIVGEDLNLTAAYSLDGRGVIGSAAYMAPERLTEDFPVTNAVDLYAIGKILHTGLMGGPFLPRGTDLQFKYILNWRPLDLSAFGPEINELVHNLVQKDPRLRPTAQEAHEELTGLLLDANAGTQRIVRSPRNLKLEDFVRDCRNDSIDEKGFAARYGERCLIRSDCYEALLNPNRKSEINEAPEIISIPFGSQRNSYSVGRMDADILITSPLVSRQHGTLRRKLHDGTNSVWEFVDNHSTNGTSIDGLAITQATISNMQYLTIGSKSSSISYLFADPNEARKEMRHKEQTKRFTISDNRTPKKKLEKHQEGGSA